MKHWWINYCYRVSVNYMQIPMFERTTYVSEWNTELHNRHLPGRLTERSYSPGEDFVCGIKMYCHAIIIWDHFEISTMCFLHTPSSNNLCFSPALCPLWSFFFISLFNLWPVSATPKRWKKNSMSSISPKKFFLHDFALHAYGGSYLFQACF